MQACIQTIPEGAGTGPAGNDAGLYTVGAGEDSDADLWDLPIPVTVVDGAQGMRLCRSALMKVTRRRDQPPGRPDRRPGLLWQPGKAGAQLRRAARTVNDAKAAFRAAVDNLGVSPAKRAQAFQGTPLQHVMLIQAYRGIEVIGLDYELDPNDSTRVVRELPVEIQAVSFSWSGASRKVVRVTRDEVLTYLENRKLFGWTSDWQKRVLETDDEHFAYVRRIAPFPIANLRIGDRFCKRVMAPVPLIYTGEAWPEVRELPSYEPGAEPGRRRVQAVEVDAVPLIPQIRLFRYLREMA